MRQSHYYHGLLGTPTGSFKIVEFSDYQCPYCAAVDPILAGFVAHHPDDAAVYRYDMPLKAIHRYAYAAAVAANCAQAEGVRFQYQSLLFQHQKELAAIDWVSLATQSGVTNTDSFARCVQNDAQRDHIQGDMEKAQSVGVKGTPTFIVNGTLLSGDLSDSRLERLYAKAQRSRKGFLGHLVSFFER